MELKTTREDMLERFRLYGEIYCLLATLPGKKDKEEFCIEGYQICDELEISSDELIFDFVNEKGELNKCEMKNDMISVCYAGSSSGYCWWCSIVQLPTDTIRRLKDLLERYVQALKRDKE